MPGLRCRRWCNAPLLSLCILYLHRVDPAAPAAGSCSNAAAGNQSGNSDGEDRLDNDPVAALRLHLHSIAAADPWYYSIVHKLQVRTGVALDVRVEKKIKKDLTGIITWDIKGVLTRKTKGK